MNENYLRRIFQDAFRKVAVRYGFIEESLPFYADYESYISLCPDKREELIKLINPDGRLLCLRMDQTVMAALHEEQKSISKNEMRRIFYFDNTFRLNPSKGILEEIPQCGLEIFQEKSVTADCESISAALEIMEELGFSKSDFKIEISNVKFPKMVVKGAVPKAQSDDSKLLERVLKLVEEKNKPAIKSLGKSQDYDTDVLTAIVDGFGDYDKIIERIKSYNLEQGALDALEELSMLKNMLGEYGIENVEVDLGATNRFHYYDSYMCRIYSLQTGKIIAAGGRYDYLGSSDMKGCGISFYDENLEELMLCLDAHQVKEYSIDFAVLGEDGNLAQSAKLASSLRKNGYKAIVMSYAVNGIDENTQIDTGILPGIVKSAKKIFMVKEDGILYVNQENGRTTTKVDMPHILEEFGPSMEVK